MKDTTTSISNSRKLACLSQREESFRQARIVSSQETQEIEANGDSCIGPVIASHCALYSMYSLNFQSEQAFVSTL